MITRILTRLAFLAFLAVLASTRASRAWVTKLEAYVADYVKTIGGNAPLTLKAVKVCLGELAKDNHKRDIGLCDRVVDDCFSSEDYTEGRTAFMEKRKAVFRGR